MGEDAAFVAAVHALDTAFVRHAGEGELGQLVAACYAAYALLLPPSLPLVQGHGQIREFFRELLGAGAFRVARETNLIHAAGTIGYGVGRYTCVCRQAVGEAAPDSGKYLLVYRRQADGAWKIALDMFSSNLPAA
ncbi:MAG TPA: hypothetical protein VIU62_22025 [Chloroflexota bacterium]